jgi:hypothetical protein
MGNDYDETEFDDLDLDVEPPLGWAEGEREAIEHKMRSREADIAREKVDRLIAARRSTAPAARTSQPLPPVPAPTRPQPNKAASSPENLAALRQQLDTIAERAAKQLDYASAAQMWPLIKTLIISSTYQDHQRRADAVEYVCERLLDLIAQTGKAMADREAPASSQRVGFLP